MRQSEEKYISLLTDFGLTFKYVEVSKFNKSEIARFNPSELREYEDSLKAYRDFKNSIDTAHLQGRAEEKSDIAKAMMNDGVPLEKIAQYTGLSLDELREIKTL